MSANSSLSLFLAAATCTLGALSFFAAAQASEVSQVPTPPWVAAVPEYAQWTVAISAAGSTQATVGKPSGKSSPQPQLLQVIKTGATKHDTVTYTDGSKDEYWYMGHLTFLTDTFIKTNICVGEFSSVDISGAGDPLCSLGFTGVDWVNASRFDAIVTYQNTTCYHYRLTGEFPAEAWIRVKDKMPVAYQVAGSLYIYSFGSPPIQPLVLPPAYQAIWDRYQMDSKRREMYQRDLGKH